MKLRDCIKILPDNIKIKKGKILITDYEEYLDFEVKTIVKENFIFSILKKFLLNKRKLLKKVQMFILF